MVALDGTLRYVPFAALYDGERYLAQPYAVALYTDAARTAERQAARWLEGGRPRRHAGLGYTRRPARGPSEMAAIVKQPGSAGVLPGIVKLDQSFTAQSFKDSLRERFPVVHIASTMVTV